MKMLFQCCERSFMNGESYCPTCNTQLAEHQAELDNARTWHASIDDVTPTVKELVARKALDPFEAGLNSSVTRAAMAGHNPARRAVFQILDIYLPEQEAAQLLKQVRDFMWIEAEKAGCDIWKKRAPRQPFVVAAKTWATNHLCNFLAWAERRVA